jgi:hypothetical protein
MKVLFMLMLFAAGLPTAQAQNWIVFIPAERDFRVLLPEPPTRATAPDGSTVFRAHIERNDYDIAFSVYRLPAGVRPLGDARAEIQQRLQARTRNEERGVRYVPDEDPDKAWERHVFRQGKAISVHRLVGHGGRDFFNSFQVTGAGLPSLGTLVQRIDTWCQSRTDAFSRAFCQYSVCLQPGYEKHAHCSALSGLTHFF